jgi:mono/diheme cytochrome c family protein
MRKLTMFVASLFAVFLLTVAARAQQGWQIPQTAAAEKSPLKSSPDLIKKGRGLFVTHCQKCHGPEGKGDGPDSNPRAPAADLTDGFRAELNPDGVMYYKIFNGKPPDMPAFKSTLAKDEIWTVVEYAKSIRK